MNHRLCSLLVLLTLCLGVNVLAQPIDYPNSIEALSALFPGKKPFEWTRTSGDFNSDGIEDLALILTLSEDNAPIQTRLVILAGSSSGRFSILSASSTYCEAQKFFNLDAKGSNLFVSAVHKADASEIASEALQFRFNRRIRDFELIGREDAWESHTDNISGRVSVNYTTGRSVEYRRDRGRTKVTRQSNFAISPTARLSGFDCGKWLASGPN